MRKIIFKARKPAKPRMNISTDHVKVNRPKGSLSFTRQQDGGWLGPMDVKLAKAGR